MKPRRLAAASALIGCIVIFSAPSTATTMPTCGINDGPLSQNECYCDPWDSYCKWLCKQH